METYLILYTNGYQETIEAESIEDAISKASGAEGYKIKMVLLL